MKKSFAKIVLLVAFVYLSLFIKIKTEHPRVIYDTKVTLAQRDIVLSKTEIPAQSTTREFYLWKEHFKCKQREIFQGDIQVMISTSSDENGNIVIDEVLDITAIGGDDEYKFIIVHSNALIDEQGNAVVFLSGCYEKQFIYDAVPFMKYLPGMFAQVKATQPGWWHSETVTFAITIEPQYIQRVKTTGEFTRQIVNTRKYDY